MDIETITNAAIEAHLWADTHDDNDPDNDSIDGRDYDLSPESRTLIAGDVEEFAKLAGDLLDGMDSGQVGHDFALTRNGHGAGFWDRGLGELGDKLTEHAKSFGSIYGYLDEGTVYLTEG